MKVCILNLNTSLDTESCVFAIGQTICLSHTETAVIHMISWLALYYKDSKVHCLHTIHITPKRFKARFANNVWSSVSVLTA